MTVKGKWHMKGTKISQRTVKVRHDCYSAVKAKSTACLWGPVTAALLPLAVVNLWMKCKSFWKILYTPLTKAPVATSTVVLVFDVLTANEWPKD